MAGKKYLIVNADDFGQSRGINRGIIQAHEHGIVTSASLMTRWPASDEAALNAKEYPRLSMGLHLDLGEWIWRDESWVPLYTVVPLEDTAAVEREVYQQLDRFRFLVGREPTHIDSHQHVHMREPLRSLALRLSESLGVPLRNLNSEIQYSMTFYGQTSEGQPLLSHISLERLANILAELPQGLTVLPCHPGYAEDLNTTYRSERAEEIRVLCDPRLQVAIQNLGIELCSFDDWHKLEKGHAPAVS
jgi:predicted glycoside hydrolase/deacetylase ChbG (UPF0249 family)